MVTLDEFGSGRRYRRSSRATYARTSRALLAELRGVRPFGGSEAALPADVRGSEL